MAIYDKQLDRYFITKEDDLVASCVGINYDPDTDEYGNLETMDAEISAVVSEDGELAKIRRAWDIPRDHPMYGRPYYRL